MSYLKYDYLKEGEDEFLKTFSTLDHKLPKSRNYLWVFWSHEILQQQEFKTNNNDSFSAQVNTRRMISDSIKCALSCGYFDTFCDEYIIQFWAPEMTTGRRVLSTSGQPFAVEFPSKELSKYRLCSMEYQYSIYEHNHGDPMIIGDTPTATAFQNNLPQVVSFKDLKEGSPLEECAFKCGLTYSYILPIYDLDRTPSSCIGVLEFSTCSVLLPETILAMIRALKEVRVGVFQIHERIPYKTIYGLNDARAEIEEALEEVCENDTTLLAQVWIHFKDDYHVPFSSDLKGARNKPMLSLNLASYLHDRGSKEPLDYVEYNRLCDMFPLEMGEDFVEKTLEDYTPRFCNDVSKLSGDTWVKEIFDFTGVSRVVICLNSSYTGDFCYAFEFIWGGDSDSDVEFVEEDPDYDVKFLGKLLLKLKKLLPNFKLASELGDEIDFINVGDSTASETKFLKILSPITEVLEEGRRIPVPMVVDYIPPSDKTTPIPLSPQVCVPMVVDYLTTPITLSPEVIEQPIGNTETEVAENHEDNSDIVIEQMMNMTDDIHLGGNTPPSTVSCMNYPQQSRQMDDNYVAPLAKIRSTAQITLSKEDIENQFGKTMAEAAKSLKVSIKTLQRRRKDHGLLQRWNKLHKAGPSGGQGGLPPRGPIK